MYIENNIIV